MFGAHHRRRTRRIRAACLSWAILAAVTVCAVGIPLPGGFARTSAERYPCQGHACGCVDAAQCWHSCCCYSPAEKLAWAKRQGVIPPRSVMALAERDKALVAGSPQSCDQTPLKTSCCSAAASPEGQACEDARSAPRRPRGKVVLLWAALKCRGVASTVATLPPALPVVVAVGCPRSGEDNEETAVRESTPYDSPFLSTPTPPPRRMS
jgi:hypothetical protein